MKTAAALSLGLLLVASARACSVSPGDGSTCSQDPCSFCAGKADGVYADPGASGKTYFDCYDTPDSPGGAECLACRGGENDAQCPGSAPASPASPVPVSPVTTAPASPAPVPVNVTALTTPVAGCTVQPGDGSLCSANPCSWCLGKADGLYADVNNTVNRTYFDCFAATAPAGAECLACALNENDTHCPLAPGAPLAPPAPPASPNPAGTCTVTPGDGSTCSQNPCSFCAGKADGTYPDVGASAGLTYYDCYDAYGPGGAECLKCWSDTWSACPAVSGPASPATNVPATPAVTSVPATPAITASTVTGAVDEAISSIASALGRKRLL